jgi:hypothetical protein
MKQLFTFFLFAFLVSAGNAQTIPNGSLESWDSLHSQTTTAYWWQPSYVGINWMGTLNSLVGLSVSVGGPGPETCIRTTDSYSGTYAAKLVSRPLILGTTSVFIPGMLGTAIMNMGGISAWLGNPCPGCKPLHFKGYYKFEPVNGDSCTIVALVSRWNSQTHQRDTIAYNALIQTQPVSTYTPFDLQLAYENSAIPDSLTLLMISSAGFNIHNFMGCTGQEGSTMYVDEVSLEYPMGIEQSLMPEVSVRIFPNPATENITVELSGRLENGCMEIFSMDGKLLKTVHVNDLKATISVSTLPAGSYFFKLRDGAHLMNTGSFIIK